MAATRWNDGRTRGMVTPHIQGNTKSERNKLHPIVSDISGIVEANIPTYLHRTNPCTWNDVNNDKRAANDREVLHI